MDGVSDHLLADAGLSQQQDGTVERGYLPDLIHDLPQAEIGANDLLPGDSQQLTV